MANKFPKTIVIKNPYKMMMCSNNILQNLGLDCQKSITTVVCGKYFDEMSSLTFILLNGPFFKNFFFSKDVV